MSGQEISDCTSGDLAAMHVPKPLRDLPIFLCWKFEPNNSGEGKPRKVPYYPYGGRRSGTQGSDQDRAQLTTFREARDQAITRGMTGIGIALLEGYNLVAIDVDNCVTDGKIDDEILHVLSSTYAEYSPSGRGVRALMYGNLGNCKSPTTSDEFGWEVFSTKGFCTLTGNMLPHVSPIGYEDRIAAVSPAVEAICQRRFGKNFKAVRPHDPLAGFAPKLGLSGSQMATILAQLDPDMTHEFWIRVGFGLNHETDGSEEGFTLWNDWSSKGEKYSNEEDLRRQWRGFQSRMRSTPPVTMATVKAMLQDADLCLYSEWPEPTPLPEALLAAPPMTEDMLPRELAPWLTDIAERMCVPLDFVGIPAMVMLGALVGRKVCIRPEDHTDWNEAANLWGAIVSPPGAMKTPVVGQVFAPIKKFEADAHALNAAALSKHELEVMAQKTALDVVLRGLKVNSATKPMDIEKALMASAAEPPRPKLKRYMTTDATVEKLGEICADNPDGILYHRDELASLMTDLQREEKASVRGFLLTGWAGLEAYTFDRIQRGTTHVEAVNLSLFGTIQPQRIANLVAASTAKHDDGLIQRLQLLAWPDLNSDWVPADRPPNASAREVALDCCRRLTELTAQSVEADVTTDQVPFLRMTGEAQEAFKEYRGGLEAKVRGKSLPEPLASHLSKYRGLIPRLALILHLCSGGTGRVTADAMRVAVKWAHYLEQHARRMYGSVDKASCDTALAILRRIRNNELRDGFSQRDITQKGWSGLRDGDQVERALKTLQEHAWLRVSKVRSAGRPKETFMINPAARAAAL